MRGANFDDVALADSLDVPDQKGPVGLSCLLGLREAVRLSIHLQKVTHQRYYLWMGAPHKKSGMMIPLYIPANNGFPWCESEAGFRPSTVFILKTSSTSALFCLEILGLSTRSPCVAFRAQIYPLEQPSFHPVDGGGLFKQYVAQVFQTFGHEQAYRRTSGEKRTYQGETH